MKNNWNYSTLGIPDEMFIRAKVPMTKQEVRIVSLGKLRINSADTVIDIGAGTGSLSIEAGLAAKNGVVYAVERKEEAVSLIKKNIEHFGLSNIVTIKGEAPNCINQKLMVDKAIIGGSGGKIDEIFNWLDLHLKPQGRIVANTVTIENTYLLIQKLKEKGYEDIDITQIGIARGKSLSNLTMMIGQNPIYIISAAKGVRK